MRRTTNAALRWSVVSLAAGLFTCLFTCLSQAAPPAALGKAEPALAPPEVPPELLHNGLWDLSILREMPGTPYRRTVTSQECRTAATSRVASSVLPRSTEEAMACQYLGVKLAGDLLSWSVQCTGKGGSLSGTASITLSGTSYQGTAQLERQAGGKRTKISETFEGKRVGDCQ